MKRAVLVKYFACLKTAFGNAEKIGAQFTLMLMFTIFNVYGSSKSGEKSMNAANKYRLQRELQVEPDVRHSSQH